MYLYYVLIYQPQNFAAINRIGGANRNRRDFIMAEAIANPSFEPPPEDDSDNEIWLLRAPANMDVSAILNDIQLDLQTSSSTSNNNILSKFKSSIDEGTEYTLTLGDSNEIDNVRLLVPQKLKKEDDSGDSSDEDDDEDTSEKLVPYTRPFKQQVHLTSSVVPTSNDNISSELILAPPISAAPKSDDPRMRVAYVPRPQRTGLKRRWNMPGANNNNKISDEEKEEVATPPTKKQKKADNDEKVGVKEEEVTESAEKSSKKSKKKSSKKEKKSRKSK